MVAEKCDFNPCFGRTRRGVSRPGKGEGSLHLYHCSIWFWTGYDLELSSFEMPVQVQANKSNGTVDVAPSSRNQSEAAEAAARLAG